MSLQQEILNIDQLAAMLAVPKSTVYGLARDGRIPGHKVGRHWRFSRQAVLRWMEQTSPHPHELDRLPSSKGVPGADC